MREKINMIERFLLINQRKPSCDMCEVISDLLFEHKQIPQAQDTGNGDISDCDVVADEEGFEFEMVI